MTKASSVSTGDEALNLLLDSTRVFEDLEYALNGPPTDENLGDVNSQETVLNETIASSSSLTKTNIIKEEDDVRSSDREWNMNLVARAWDPRLKPMSEFRGICWDNNFTCLAQYYHPLYFEELQDETFLSIIEHDIREAFEGAREAVKQLGGNCIIDFAWLGEV